MKKRHGALRADTLRVLANPGKEREVLRLLPTTAGSRSSSDACSGAGSLSRERPTNTSPPST
jgi:hypothetical protein